METQNSESSGPPFPASSIYFTSILPAPASAQHEEIQMKSAGCACGDNELGGFRSSCDTIGNGELHINCVYSGEERRDYSAERRPLP